jgi:hypothetical protein
MKKACNIQLFKYQNVKYHISLWFDLIWFWGDPGKWLQKCQSYSLIHLNSFEDNKTQSNTIKWSVNEFKNENHMKWNGSIRMNISNFIWYDYKHGFGWTSFGFSSTDLVWLSFEISRELLVPRDCISFAFRILSLLFISSYLFGLLSTRN